MAARPLWWPRCAAAGHRVCDAIDSDREAAAEAAGLSIVTDPLAAAIAHHLRIAGELMAATRQAEGVPSLSNAEVIARLDLILAKLDEPVAPFEHRLWDVRELAAYLHRHPETARSITALPDFPAAISLPGRGAGRGKLLYRATEIIEWAASYQEKRRR